MSNVVYALSVTADLFEQATRLIRAQSLAAEDVLSIHAAMAATYADLRRNPLTADEIRGAMDGMTDVGPISINLRVEEPWYGWYTATRDRVGVIVGRPVVSRELFSVLIRAAVRRHEQPPEPHRRTVRAQAEAN